MTLHDIELVDSKLLGKYQDERVASMQSSSWIA